MIVLDVLLRDALILFVTFTGATMARGRTPSMGFMFVCAAFVLLMELLAATSRS